VSEDQDWRLKISLEGQTRGALDRLIGRLRGPDVVHELQSAVPHDVVLTHDGRLLFAYTANRALLTATQKAIEGVLSRENAKADICVSHWDDGLDAWRQTDPPREEEEEEEEEEERVRGTPPRDAGGLETRTMVASAGKLIRGSFEQSLLEWARELGLECTIVEHPHLLRTQVAFTVTGRRRKLEEFSEGLRAVQAATIRAEGLVMLSPL
jgi:hypothetical protein